jgi:hypothetical protein
MRVCPYQKWSDNETESLEMWLELTGRTTIKTTSLKYYKKAAETTISSTV